MDAASVADWAAIDILSVGLGVGLKNEFHNTLLIAVAPGSMSWHQGHVLALRCKAILEEHGIKDMHCEIRESTLTFGANAPEDAVADAPTDDSGTPDSVLSGFQLLVSSEPITYIFYENYHRYV